MIKEDNDYPVKAAAQELGIPEEQVHLVAVNLWKAVRFYLTNPHLVKAGVLLRDFVLIKLSTYAVEAYIEKVMFEGAYISNFRPGLDYLKDILKNVYKNNLSTYDEEKVKARLQKLDGLEKHHGRGSSHVKTTEGTFDKLFYAKLRKYKRDRPRKIYDEEDGE